MKRLLIPFLLLSVSIASFGRVICDSTCHTPDDGLSNFAVVSPVGHSVVTPIEQAPRLSTLEGKTIAVVGVSFMAHVTHPEIKRLILENYPKAKVICSEVCKQNLKKEFQAYFLLYYDNPDYKYMVCRVDDTVENMNFNLFHMLK